MGFIFIRFRSGPQPSVAELMKPVADELAHYKIADMVPLLGHLDAEDAGQLEVRARRRQ